MKQKTKKNYLVTWANGVQEKQGHGGQYKGQGKSDMCQFQIRKKKQLVYIRKKIEAEYDGRKQLVRQMGKEQELVDNIDDKEQVKWISLSRLKKKKKLVHMKEMRQDEGKVQLVSQMKKKQKELAVDL